MHPAAQDESELLADCEVRRQRRSGPGGQHRNKVETAVVIEHRPTGIRGEASERRSQEENRRRAIFRLRVNLAIRIRVSHDPSTFRPSDTWTQRCRGGILAISPNHPEFPALLAEALDVIAACESDLKLAAGLLGCSTTQLVKLLSHEPEALGEVNAQRIAQGLRPYHH